MFAAGARHPHAGLPPRRPCARATGSTGRRSSPKRTRRPSSSRAGEAEVTPLDHLVLERVAPRPGRAAVGTSVDPVMLEIFNNLFMSIAEQMGFALANTAYSVNIKERLDFSCALFDAAGNLIANAPHMPVHLGSMGESIRTVIRENRRADAAGRRVHAQRAVQRRHAPPGHHRDHAGVRRARRRDSVLRRFARSSRRHRRDHARLDAARLAAPSTRKAC